MAAGIQVTGGLGEYLSYRVVSPTKYGNYVIPHIVILYPTDWYMSKLLGRPSSIPSAQIRLMLPISLVSAFLNNTPVVVVMIPIVQKWGKNIGTKSLVYESYGMTCEMDFHLLINFNFIFI